MIGHLNGTGNKLQGRDDYASKGNTDVGPEKDGREKAKPKKKRSALEITSKIKGLR